MNSGVGAGWSNRLYRTDPTKPSITSAVSIYSYLVAGARFERATSGYEPEKIPFLHPAFIVFSCNPVSGFVSFLHWPIYEPFLVS